MKENKRDYIWEKEKNNKEKKSNSDDTRIQYLASIPQDDNLTSLSVLVKSSPWTEGNPDGDS